MTRTAKCACGQLQLLVSKKPFSVVTCHCHYCQRRTGSVFQVSAVFSDDAGIDFLGESQVYNGLKERGSGTTNGNDISYHFCPRCGSTVFWTFAGRPTLVVAVGCFADPDFPVPTAELHSPFRHHWVQPIDTAEQFEGFRIT
jgi:hypothetical protein